MTKHQHILTKNQHTMTKIKHTMIKNPTLNDKNPTYNCTTINLTHNNYKTPTMTITSKLSTL